MGDIVRYNDAPARKRLWSALVLAVVFWMLLTGGKMALPWSEPLNDHGPHPVAAAMGGEFAVQLDHPHLQQDGPLTSPETVATAVIPRPTNVLAALAMGIAVVAVWTWSGYWTRARVRGPPDAPNLSTPGRQLLARLCISRR